MACSKRDFGRAFDEPAGIQGDVFAAEPQDIYSSPARYVPGQWPEDNSIIEEASAPATSTSFLTTLAHFATSITLEVCKTPRRLRQRFTRPQQIVAVPIIRQDGASKRRLVDAGLAPITPTRRRDSAGRQGPDVTRTPGLWVEIPPSPTSNLPQHSEGLQDDGIDDSLDWSMDDVDSGTPPHNPRTGSSTGISWLRRPERGTLTPKTRVISPNSQFTILRRSSVTPMRKQLLKKQLRAVEAVTVTSSPVLRQPDHTWALPISPSLTITELKKKALESSVLSINAPAVAASARYKAELEDRENRDAEARATAEHNFLNPVETVDIDLSYRPDASNLSSSFESLRTPSPSPSQKRSIRWASQSRVKSYYVDERISDMLDSTLDSIRLPIPKPNFEDDEDDDEDAKDLQGITFKNPCPTSDSDDSVDGPSLDGSLEESQLSSELLQDLEDDFKNLLARQPPPPPPPKPLIAPLTDKERAQLQDIATKSKHGRNESYPILPDKISARDFGTLLPDQFNGSAKAWLNDEIVNQYLFVIMKSLNDDCGFVYKRGGPAPPYHAFSSHWYTSIKGGVKKVERWAGRVGLGGAQFLDAKIVLFPICDGSHWRLLAVKPQERTIEYLDSLGWEGAKYVAKLREYLQNELKDLWKAEEWTVVELQRSSRQLNGSDCGVFVLLNALVLLRGDECKKVIACNGMLEARERLAMTIITGHPVELDY
ncbi:cysteine proteinase [Macroventuria anomochaeta]|uniref:Cysteine proteinase n=1 Tax=Macroventuria anomochaeta TaxID=301207 RepID=A0ACB6SCE5_9PLEO|nr:cysteine proteinase [Macroventuria anomochaeta]KAF2631013.1 cysteine proteinase [Macroventuria anomochaeta]